MIFFVLRQLSSMTDVLGSKRLLMREFILGGMFLAGYFGSHLLTIQLLTIVSWETMLGRIKLNQQFRFNPTLISRRGIVDRDRKREHS